MIDEPKCFSRNCKWFFGVREIGGEGEEYQTVVCLAYPNGIPEDIAFGRNLHLTRRDDQSNDIVYEKGNADETE